MHNNALTTINIITHTDNKVPAIITITATGITNIQDLKQAN